MKPVEDQIRSRMNAFTTAERSVAEYVLRNEDVIYESITTTAESCQASYGTIIRFCQKLGFSGFQDFKIHLALDKGMDRQELPAEDKDWLHQMADKASKQIESTIAAIDEEKLFEVAKHIAKTKKTLVIGVAGSFPTAMELSYKLSRLGINANAESDAHMQAIRSSALGKDDVLIAVSFSGSTKEILDAAQIAKKRGAYIAILTNYEKSPLTEISDQVLITSIWEEALEAEIGSRLPFYFLIEAICRTIYTRFPDRASYIGITAESVSGKQI